jgi:hypothetical protein
MRYGGEPTSSLDTTAVMTFGFVSSSFTELSAYFSGSQSSSLDTFPTPDRQNFTINLPSGTRLRNGAVQVSVNGSLLNSFANQESVDNGVVGGDIKDYFIPSASSGILSIHKPNVNGGISLDVADDIFISYGITKS